jgi:hypothetical protein
VTDRSALEAAIRAAFADVTLGAGTSLRQTAALDASDGEVPRDELDAARRGEVTDDWTQIPAAELTSGVLAQLDAEGLRYYLPALLLWVLDHYDDAAARASDESVGLTVIGTLGSLAPSELFADELYLIYDGFTPEQRSALAGALEALPTLLHLDEADAERVAIAMDEYWSQFLPVD